MIPLLGLQGYFCAIACKWIAQLMQYGLLKASFVSLPEVRHWWDLTRHRTELRDQEPVAVSSQAEGNP